MRAVNQKKADAIGKKIRAQLEALLQLARDAGVPRPRIYIESEGGVYVTDGSAEAPRDGQAERQKAVVFSVSGALPFGTDVGAW